MKKNHWGKIGLLLVATAGIATLSSIPSQSGASVTTNVTLTISGGSLTIGSTGSFNLGTITVSSSPTDIQKQFTGSDYFFVEDLIGANSGYYTTLSITSLNGPGGAQISNNNIFVKAGFATPVLLTGTANPNVQNQLSNVTYVALNNPVTYIKRDSGVNSGVIGKYGDLPWIKIQVPAFQSVGSYSGTLTYTIIEN